MDMSEMSLQPKHAKDFLRLKQGDRNDVTLGSDVVNKII